MSHWMVLRLSDCLFVINLIAFSTYKNWKVQHHRSALSKCNKNPARAVLVRDITSSGRQMFLFGLFIFLCTGTSTVVERRCQKTALSASE
ncbi:hypothetical protein NQ317_008024 [Molorchus minor]|uniref:Secreted protein n=1 Tax=Molorchus minor TaxID=1323400 RepID=A0ABQ9JW37_9CUCU|nr:hypothetical protein NQ317_008024 [Molorchus minor]